MVYNYLSGARKTKSSLLTIITAALFMAVTVAFSLNSARALTASNNYTLFGEASLVSPGSGSDTALMTTSDSDPGFGGVSLEVPGGATFGSLSNFSSDFNVTDDNCGGGSPRLSIKVDTGSGNKNIFAYFGPSPNYDACTPDTWVNTGDLLESGKTVDTGQLAGGTFYHDYDSAVTAYGSLPVVGLSVVIDSSWSGTATGGDGEQTVLFDNIVVNDTLYNFELTAQNQCKNDGWVAFGFRNQGQCIRFVNTGQDSR